MISWFVTTEEQLSFAAGKVGGPPTESNRKHRELLVLLCFLFLPHFFWPQVSLFLTLHHEIMPSVLSAFSTGKQMPPLIG